ncbi:hypothetical protein BCF33_2477 [Hasllibacter halocynthiae]|uniref:Uncharacterized protein n=1 Tax=Hasllibacter halocynthiae TaxID=595589 RepID=A0A2T0X3V4_9RHOB|nr:hypothetical protein [Hasllibacter halocynthiae]PRY93597.1 hypothetical protein BCF33_2477 [Hasllibacter halocynthiae]
MIRPELRDALRRWREVLAGAALAVLGLWMTAGIDTARWLGFAVALGGGALAVAGLRLGRFRRGGEGPGIVSVDERRIAYMGPLTGGTAAVDGIRRLDLDPSARPDPAWVVTTRDGALHIPVTAKGADALYDAFAALPGIDTGRMLAELDKRDGAAVAIWEHPDEARARRRLPAH